MPKPANSFPDLVAQEINRQREMLGRAIAADLGPPADSVKLSDADELREWLVSDPSVDVVALVQQGMSVREANALKYPKRRELVSRGRPSLKEQVEFAGKMRERALKALAEPVEMAPSEDELIYG